MPKKSIKKMKKQRGGKLNKINNKIAEIKY